MRLVPYLDPSSLDGLAVAPGWPHDDTADALGFVTGESGAWTWLILDDHDRVAGECGVKGPPGPDGTVEIGYGLAAPSRGRGLGTRAVAALLDELAVRPGVTEIVAEAEVGNLPSRRLLERLGFASDGESNGYARYRVGIRPASDR